MNIAAAMAALTFNAEAIPEVIEAERSFIAELERFLGECKRHDVQPGDVITLIEAGYTVERAIAHLVLTRPAIPQRSDRVPLLARLARLGAPILDAIDAPPAPRRPPRRPSKTKPSTE